MNNNNKKNPNFLSWFALGFSIVLLLISLFK